MVKAWIQNGEEWDEMVFYRLVMPNTLLLKIAMYREFPGGGGSIVRLYVVPR